MDKITVSKGDSTIVKELTLEGYDTLDANWTGRKVVRVDLDTAPVLDEIMVKDVAGTMFLGYLEPVETDTLEVGSYIVIYEIENLVILPKFRKETKYKLKVTQEGIATP